MEVAPVAEHGFTADDEVGLSSRGALIILAQQHGQYGDELQGLGAYRAARSHYVEGLHIAEKLEGIGDDFEDIGDDLSALRFNQSLDEAEDRFRFERLNLATLIAFDRNRHWASVELFDKLLEAPLDDEMRQNFSRKRSRVLQMAVDRDSIIEVFDVATGPLVSMAEAASDQKHDVLAALILAAADSICNEAISTMGVPRAVTMSPEQVIAFQRDATQIKERLQTSRSALLSRFPDNDPGRDIARRLHSIAKTQLEDVETIMSSQAGETHRDVLLRPSVVVDVTMVDKIAIGTQAYSLLTLINPNDDDACERLQALSRLETTRNGIMNQRRSWVTNPMCDLLNPIANRQEPPNLDQHVVLTVHSAIRDLSTAISTIDVAALIDNLPLADSTIIVDRFLAERKAGATGRQASVSQLESFLGRARRQLLAALSTTEGSGLSLGSFEHAETTVRAAHSLMDRVLGECRSANIAQRLALRPIQLQVDCGLQQCLRTLEVVRCRHETHKCMSLNDKERALKWSVRAACHCRLDQGEGEVVAAAAAFVDQIRARANLVIGIDALEALPPLNETDGSGERLVADFMTRAQTLDPNDATIRRWAKAYRLRSEGAAIFARQHYRRAQAVFEECIELVDCEAFRSAERIADQMVYKQELRAAADRQDQHKHFFRPAVGADATAHALPVLAGRSRRTVNMTQLVEDIVNGILKGPSEERADYVDAVQAMLATHPALEEPNLTNEELGSLTAACISGLEITPQHTMADIEGAVHNQAAIWLTTRAQRQRDEEDRHRQHLMRIAGRAVRVVYEELGLVVNPGSRWFCLLLSALHNNDKALALLRPALTSLGPDVVGIRAGRWMGRELSLLWPPDTQGRAMEENEALASQIVEDWVERELFIRDSVPDSWTDTRSELASIADNLLGRLVSDESVSSILEYMEHMQLSIVNDMANPESNTYDIARGIVARVIVEQVARGCRQFPRLAFALALTDAVRTALIDPPPEPKRLADLVILVGDILSSVPVPDSIDLCSFGIRFAFDVWLHGPPSYRQTHRAVANMASTIFTRRVTERSQALDDAGGLQRQSARALGKHLSSDRPLVTRVMADPAALFPICNWLVDQVAASSGTRPPSSSPPTDAEHIVHILRKLVLPRLVPIERSLRRRSQTVSWLDDVLRRALSIDVHARFLNGLLSPSRHSAERIKLELVNRIVSGLKPLVDEAKPEGDTAEQLTVDGLQAVKRAISDCKNTFRS